MEVEGRSSKTKTKGPDDQRLILRCADDEGNFMCFICGDYAPSAKTLYDHLKSSSCCNGWSSVLPKNLSDFSTVVIRHTLLITPHSHFHSHSSIKLKEEGECSSGRFLPAVDKWNIGIGSKRSAPSPHVDHNDRTKEDAPNYSRNNRSKVVADAPDSTNHVNDRAAVGKVVHDFDLNELPIMELPDDQ